MELDERIHRAIYRLAAMRSWRRALEQYYVHALRIWYLALDRARELGAAVQEHRELLEAISSGDARRSEKLMRAHVQHFEDRDEPRVAPALEHQAIRRVAVTYFVEAYC